jgi:hypothetical protein
MALKIISLELKPYYSRKGILTGKWDTNTGIVSILNNSQDYYRIEDCLNIKELEEIKSDLELRIDLLEKLIIKIIDEVPELSWDYLPAEAYELKLKVDKLK